MLHILTSDPPSIPTYLQAKKFCSFTSSNIRLTELNKLSWVNKGYFYFFLKSREMKNSIL